MSDRELLELAAKAAGINGRWFELDAEFKLCPPAISDGTKRYLWRPLQDDGDALRLALKLGICIQFIPECDTVQVYQERPTTGESFNVHVAGLGDIETRRIITQAAAEIGRTML